MESTMKQPNFIIILLIFLTITPVQSFPNPPPEPQTMTGAARFMGIPDHQPHKVTKRKGTRHMATQTREHFLPCALRRVPCIFLHLSPRAEIASLSTGVINVQYEIVETP